MASVTFPYENGIQFHDPSQDDPPITPLIVDNNNKGKKCIMCSKQDVPLNHCIKCAPMADYCSSACQKADWPEHKHLCLRLHEFLPQKQPSATHSRAILFPVGNETPEPVWVHRESRDGSITLEHSDLDDFKGVLGVNELRSARLTNIPISKESIDDAPVLSRTTVVLCINQGIAAAYGPQALNKSLNALGPGVVKPWFGPVVLVAHVTTYDDETSSEDGDDSDATSDSAAGSSVADTLQNHRVDVTMSDYRKAIDFFQNHPKNVGVANPSRYLKGPLVPAILMLNPNDESNKAMLPNTRLTFINTPAHHEHEELYTLTIPNLLGLSWYARDGDTMPKKTDERRFDMVENIKFKYLNIVSDLTPVDGGKAHHLKVWFAAFGGAAVIIHAKGLRIRREHITVFQLYIDRCVANGETPTEAGFMSCWTEQLRAMSARGLPVGEIPDPYVLERYPRESVLKTPDEVELIEYHHRHRPKSWERLAKTAASKDGGWLWVTPRPEPEPETAATEPIDQTRVQKAKDWLTTLPRPEDCEDLERN